jgi:hypothetical protein
LSAPLNNLSKSETFEPRAGSLRAGSRKTLIVGTGQREHRDLQRGVAHADAFSLSQRNLEYYGTAIFARDCLWQVKMKLWLLAVFTTFSMIDDRPALQI